MLEVNSLNKSYENFSLKDVTFTINNDCITGFIGTNGSGKTTTIKVILGLFLKYSIKIYFSEKYHCPSYTDWDEPVFQDYIKQFTLNLKQKISTLSKGIG